MPTSIIITHLPPPPPLVLKHPRCLSKVLSTQHSTGCLLNATRKPCYRENFISIKQLHGNSPRAQGTQQPSYPLVFHYFWEHLNEEDIQSATCQRGPSRLQRRERPSRYLSINWLALRHHRHPDLNLKSLLHLWLEVWQQAVASILKSANSILSDWVWSDGHYNRLTSILITGQKKDKSNL